MDAAFEERLRGRWDALRDRLGVPAGRVPAFEKVRDSYSEPGRHYHTLTHVADCLGELDGVRHLCGHPDAVEAALWYHDIVYDPRRPDNEARSAAVASNAMRAAGVSREFIASVELLILATRHTAPQVAPDEQLIADIDLSILGRAADEFDAYEWAIRREYEHVSDRDFATGRTRFLRGLLARPRIYATDAFARRYEESARRNLHRSVERWESGLAERRTPDAAHIRPRPEGNS